jgi:hypothetical protein
MNLKGDGSFFVAILPDTKDGVAEVAANLEVIQL